MSELNRTRYEVQKIIADNIKAGLSAYLGTVEFTVLEYAQASFQKGDRLITIQPLRVNRVGWQSSRYKSSADTFRRIEEYVEEQSWQIQVILKKSKNPTISDMQSDDVAGILVSWFNGIGCDEFRKKNCANLRIDSDSIMVYNDDSELYQKRAVFTLKLQVPKELSMFQLEMEAIAPNIKPI